MKIPTILAQTQVPAGLPQGDLGPSGAGQYNQLAGNIAQLGGVANELAHIQRQQQAQQDRDSALDITSDSAQKAELLREQVKSPYTPENPHGYPEEEAPSRSMAERYLKGYDKMAQETIQKAPNDQVKRYVNEALLRLRKESAVQITRDQFATYKDEQIAGVPARLEEYRAQIVNSPGQRDTLTLARDLYIDTLTSIPASQRAKMKLEEQQRSDMGIAQRAVDERPFDSIGQYAATLSPENYLKLTYHQESRQNAAIKERERIQTQAEKDAEEARQYKLSQLSEMFLQGQGSETLISQSRQIGLIKKPSEVEHYYSLLKPRETPSDPAVLSDLTAKVFHPSTASVGVIREIQAAMTAHNQGGKGINPVDGRTLLGHLSGQITSQDKESYTLAKEEGLRALGITTPMSQLDKKEAKLVSEFERQYNAIARPANPNGISGRDALYQILPQFQSRQSAEARLDYMDQAKVIAPTATMPVPDPLDQMGFLAWYGEQVKATEALRADPRKASEYMLRRERLRIFLDTQRSLYDAETRRLGEQSKGSSGGSSERKAGGYTPPKGQ